MGEKRNQNAVQFYARYRPAHNKKKKGHMPLVRTSNLSSRFRIADFANREKDDGGFGGAASVHPL